MVKEQELIINGENLPLGRLAAFAAKQSLYGNKVIIANCEKILISGNKKAILEDYKQRRARGTAEQGPFFPRTVEGIVKRAVRGMLSYKQARGREAFKRIKCRKGPIEGMVSINIKKPISQKCLTIGELSRIL